MYQSPKFQSSEEKNFTGDNVVILFVSGLCGEIGTLNTIQCTSGTSPLMTSNIWLCNLSTTNLTSSFFVAVEGRHVGNESLTK